MSYGFQIKNPNGDIVVDDRFRNFSFIEKRVVTLDSAGDGSFVVSGYSDLSANAPKPLVFVKLSTEPAYIKSINKATGVASGFSWDINSTTLTAAGSANGMVNTLAYYYDEVGSWGDGSKPGATGSYTASLSDRGYHTTTTFGGSQYYRNASTGERYGSIAIDLVDGLPSDDNLGGWVSPNNVKSTHYTNRTSGSGASSAITVVTGGSGWTVGDTIFMQMDVTLSQNSSHIQPFRSTSDTSGGGGNINNYGIQSGLHLTCESVTDGWNVEVGGRENGTVEAYVFAPTPTPFGNINDFGLKVSDSNGDVVFTTSDPQLTLASVLNISATYNRGTYQTSDYTNFTWTIPSGDPARSIPSGKMAVAGGTVNNGLWGVETTFPPNTIGPPYAVHLFRNGVSGLTVDSSNTTISCITRSETDSVLIDEFTAVGLMYPYWNTPGTTRPTSPTYTSGYSSLTVQEYVPVIDTSRLDEYLGF